MLHDLFDTLEPHHRVTLKQYREQVLALLGQVSLIKHELIMKNLVKHYLVVFIVVGW